MLPPLARFVRQLNQRKKILVLYTVPRRHTTIWRKVGAYIQTQL
jgi:hypothetical protein